VNCLDELNDDDDNDIVSPDRSISPRLTTIPASPHPRCNSRFVDTKKPQYRRCTVSRALVQRDVCTTTLQAPEIVPAPLDHLALLRSLGCHL